jgi:hypothetical protein
MFVQRVVIPAGLTVLALIWFGFLTFRQQGPDVQYADDVRLAQAFACSGEDMFQHVTWLDNLYDKAFDLGTSEAGAEELRRRAETGQPDWMFVLGFYLVSADGDDWDEPAGFDWLSRAANAGNPYAQNEIGAAYRYGYYGAEPDHEQAQLWLERAAERGDSYASFSLGRLLEEGFLPPTRPERQGAMEHYLDSAAQCFASAVNVIADQSGPGGLLPLDPGRAETLKSEIDRFQEAGGYFE